MIQPINNKGDVRQIFTHCFTECLLPTGGWGMKFNCNEIDYIQEIIDDEKGVGYELEAPLNPRPVDDQEHRIARMSPSERSHLSFRFSLEIPSACHTSKFNKKFGLNCSMSQNAILLQCPSMHS